MYGSPEPALSEAYKVLGPQLRAERAATTFVGPRIEELLRQLQSHTARLSVKVEPGPWAPCGANKPVLMVTDFCWYIAENCDPHGALVRFLLGSEAELFERYALARAEYESVKVIADSLDDSWSAIASGAKAWA